MENTKNKKQALWIYAVVLFMSAIIVLIITTFSQLKNKAEYDKSESENSKFKTTLSEAIKKNEKLSKENEKTKNKNKALTEKLKKFETDEKYVNGKNSDAAVSYEGIIDAQDLYEKGKINESAEMLNKNVKYELLSTSGKKTYDNLKNRTFSRAMYSFYSQGIDKMDIAEYDKARDFLKRAYDLGQMSDIADDCLYYLGFCENKLGNFEKSSSYLEKLLKEYPESSFKNSAEKINNENKDKQKKESAAPQ